MPQYYYGLNLLENPYADDGLEGWETVSVTVGSNGSYGDFHWVLGQNAEMKQEITEEDDLVGEGEAYRIRVDFRLGATPNTYATEVKALARLEYHYGDGSIDLFSCLLTGDQGKVSGVVSTDWNLGEGHCDTAEGKDLSKVVVVIKTIDKENGLDVDHVRLQKAFDPAQAVYGDIAGDLEEGKMPVVIFTRNNHLMIDRWGLSPDYIKRHPNMVKNSGFERYEEESMIPHEWTGEGTVTTEESWEGRACLKLEPGQTMSQEIEPF